jgi:hypothetical protein
VGVEQARSPIRIPPKGRSIPDVRGKFGAGKVLPAGSAGTGVTARRSPRRV